jgi:DNA repair protein RAD16
MKIKGKGKVIDDDDDELAASIVESEDSGSEFQASEEESVILQGSDEEEVMLDAAIHMSLQTARLKHFLNDEAGPSSSRLLPSSRATLHAAAIERRLASLNDDDADFAIDSVPDSDPEFHYISSDEEALSKSKGKAKAKGKIPQTAPNVMTCSELRKTKSEARRRQQAERKGNRQEEYAMSRKLGRKLTQVNSYSRISSIARLMRLS